MRTVAVLILLFNSVAVALVVVLAVSGVDASPHSPFRTPACATLFWAVLCVPGSTLGAAVILRMRAHRGTRVARVGLRVAVCLAVVWGLFMLSSPIWRRGYSYEIHQLDYATASKDLVVARFVPPEAGDITARITPFMSTITASFAVSEEAFVAWARKQEWRLEEVRDVEVNNISLTGDSNDRVTIREGWLYRWVYDPERPWRLLRIYAYDRSRGMGFFTQLGD